MTRVVLLRHKRLPGAPPVTIFNFDGPTFTVLDSGSVYAALMKLVSSQLVQRGTIYTFRAEARGPYRAAGRLRIETTADPHPADPLAVEAVMGPV